MLRLHKLPFETEQTMRAAIDDPSIPREELWERMAAYGRKMCRRGSQPKVEALMAAGWQLVLPDGCMDPEPFQWQWRRPGKRQGKPGRLFKSTDQAYNHLLREQQADA